MADDIQKIEIVEPSLQIKEKKDIKKDKGLNPKNEHEAEHEEELNENNKRVQERLEKEHDKKEGK